MRESIWLLKDKELRQAPNQAEIHFYNPREDSIPIGHIDFIISDKGYQRITADNQGSIIQELFAKQMQQ